jgi:alpha-glucosidase
VRHLSRYALDPGTDTVAWLRSDGTQPHADLALGLKRARAACLLMLALPGSAYMYQGEELGLPEVADIAPQFLQDPTWERSDHHDKGRDGCRVPVPWEPDGPSFGFGSAGAWIPQPDDWAALAWATQEGDSASILELYRTALRWRRTFAAAFAADETLTWIDKGPTMLSFARANGLVCVVNFGPHAAALPEGKVIVTSHQLDDGGRLPGDAAAWVLTN